MRSIIISLTTIIAISLVIYSIVTWGGDIGISTNETLGKSILIVLMGIHALFMIVFIGDLVEYFKRKPGIVTMLTIVIVELIFIYAFGLASDSLLFSGSFAAVLLALIYTLVAS